jgi:hypothetical protein
VITPVLTRPGLAQSGRLTENGRKDVPDQRDSPGAMPSRALPNRPKRSGLHARPGQAQGEGGHPAAVRSIRSDLEVGFCFLEGEPGLAVEVDECGALRPLGRIESSSSGPLTLTTHRFTPDCPRKLIRCATFAQPVFAVAAEVSCIHLQEGPPL